MSSREIACHMTRRRFGLALSFLCASLSGAKAQSGSTAKSFFYCRSGKITPASADGVFLGGLLLDNKEFIELEQILSKEAQRSPLTRPLRYSTSPHDTRYLVNALDRLPEKALFVGVTVKAPTWATTGDAFEYWREYLEKKSLKALGSLKEVTNYTLKHDQELDKLVFASILQTESLGSFVIHSSENETSRTFQLSNVILKCIANRRHILIADASIHKKNQISSVLEYYGLSPEISLANKENIKISFLEA